MNFWLAFTIDTKALGGLYKAALHMSQTFLVSLSLPPTFWWLAFHEMPRGPLSAKYED